MCVEGIITKKLIIFAWKFFLLKYKVYYFPSIRIQWMLQEWLMNLKNIIAEISCLIVNQEIHHFCDNTKYRVLKSKGDD